MQRGGAVAVGMEPSDTITGRDTLPIEESVDSIDNLLVSESHTFLVVRWDREFAEAAATVKFSQGLGSRGSQEMNDPLGIDSTLRSASFTDAERGVDPGRRCRAAR